MIEDQNADESLCGMVRVLSPAMFQGVSSAQHHFISQTNKTWQQSRR